MPKMYEEYAHLWPLLSDPQGYAFESLYWKRALREHLGPGRHRLLSLGAGGGNHLHHLLDEHEASAVDLSEGMFGCSRRLNPGVSHHLGDMRSVRLGETFDAVLFHDGVAYLTSREDLRAALETARTHLRPGGVVLLVPDHVSESFRDPSVRTKTCRDGELEVTFLEYACDPDPDDERYETRYVYLFREGGGRPSMDSDVHVHGLFSRGVWERLLAEAGFRVEVRDHLPDRSEGGGLMFVGTLPGS